jgi:hypothetical protein
MFLALSSRRGVPRGAGHEKVRGGCVAAVVIDPRTPAEVAVKVFNIRLRPAACKCKDLKHWRIPGYRPIRIVVLSTLARP